MRSRSSDIPGTLLRFLFPVGLVVLLILSIPGVVLFILHLLRMEGMVNKWLEGHFRLSYHLYIPWWGALFLLLVPFLIVLLYFLKLKRKPLQVPSTFLWRKSIEDVHVNSLFQWLRENILLLLQLLTVLFLIFGVMAFQLHGAPSEGRSYIILFDNSASMSATDVTPNRLEVARKEALETIDSYTDNDAGMVIVFDSSAKTLQSFTTDRNLLRRAVRDITQSQASTRIEGALSLAESLANPQRSTENEAVRPEGEEPGKERTYVPVEGVQTEVHLFSDGRFPDVDNFTLGNLNMNYHPIGEMDAAKVNNFALVQLAVRRPERVTDKEEAAKKKEDTPKIEVFVRVCNYHSEPVPKKVRLEVQVNGEMQKIYEKDLDWLAAVSKPPAGGARSDDKPGEGTVIFALNDVDDAADTVLHARLVDVEDNLDLDNEAWLVVGVVRKARVLVVSDGNQILNAFFKQKATENVAAIKFITAAELKKDDVYRKPALEGAFDLVVFDRCSPDNVEDLPQANTLFIDAIRPPWKRADMPKLEYPHVKGWDSKHPLLRLLVGLHSVTMKEAFRFELDPQKNPGVPARTSRLLESDRGTALLFALQRQSFTDVIMAFPLVYERERGYRSTDWPLDMSFVMFMYNVLYNLGNVSDAANEEPVKPGEVKSLRPDAPVKQIEVVDPAGNATALDRGSRPDFSYGHTDHVGVYQVKWDGKVQRSFAVNLFDAEESNIRPRAEIGIGSTKIGKGETRSTPARPGSGSCWGAWVYLSAEWFLYNRRVFI